MSRLSDLLRELGSREPALARDLEREVTALADRRAFGLNFERHVPEAVELPGRKVRKGDKVRILPPRGQVSRKLDGRLWRVAGIDRSTGVATLELLASPASAKPAIEGGAARSEPSSAALDDLVVVAEFRDPIYPGLVSTGRVERGGDRPFHTVINAENFHALETLLFTHRGRIDCIYIDPPYNTGAKDWKYNNDYVEGDDLYRHSKWLAMMERRLLIARELLNPADSALIVTIDEKEYLRLGMLLQQTFPDASIQMISTLINSKGTGRANELRRVNEYLYFLWFGSAKLGTLRTPSPEVESDGVSEADDGHEAPKELDDEGNDSESGEVGVGLDWQTFRRRDLASRRGTKKGGPRQFYPIYVNTDTGYIEAVGDPLPHDASRDSAPARLGCVAVFPIRKDGTEMNWSSIGPTFMKRWKSGYARAGKATPDEAQKFIIQYLKEGSITDIEQGRAKVIGRNPDGSVIAEYPEAPAKTPTTQWAFKSHNSEHYGTGVLTSLIPNRAFPFPKSLYAVEDSLRIFVGDKPDSVILDFFSGSGTTAHAVMRLNRQDGGLRQCISVTNNEVAADEQAALRKQGLRPNDADWERWGICEHIMKARLTAAITGKTPDGKPIKGDYKFTDEFPMAEGLDENVEFFTLTYEAPLRVASNREFTKIAPLLWLRAGCKGRRIDQISRGWDVADVYGVLADLDHTSDFVKAVAANEKVAVVYVVTDEDRLFESVVQELPDRVEPVRLYEAYLRNFEIESGRGSL
jgi:adenine-specific DNA-methyltransferase